MNFSYIISTPVKAQISKNHAYNTTAFISMKREGRELGNYIWRSLNLDLWLSSMLLLVMFCIWKWCSIRNHCHSVLNILYILYFSKSCVVDLLMLISKHLSKHTCLLISGHISHVSKLTCGKINRQKGNNLFESSPFLSASIKILYQVTFIMQVIAAARTYVQL